MPWLRLNNFEAAGYVADIDAHLLQPQQISHLKNAHCVDGILERYFGYTAFPVNIERLFYLLAGGFTYPWLLGITGSKVYSLTTISATDVTPPGFLPSNPNQIIGGVLHGLGIFTNGVNIPYSWNGTVVNPLTAWPSNQRCQMIRPFKNFLIAGDITNPSGNFPTKLIWSTAADPGTLPNSWAENDPTKDSGSVTLSDDSGKIIDGMQNADSFFVYKETSVYELRYVGGLYIFAIYPRFKNFGILAKNAIVSVNNQMYAFGQDDIVVHNATEMHSIATKQILRRVFNGIISAYQRRAFTLYDSQNKEILFCVPWNSEYPDHAFTYNPFTGKWGERDLPQITCGRTEIAHVMFDPWNEDNNNWDSDNTSWDKDRSTVSTIFLGGEKLFALNDSLQHWGVNPTVIMERKSIDFGTFGQPNERIKFISIVRPNIIADAGVTVQVSLGSQMKLSDPINWTPPKTFTVGTTRDLHFRLNGRYISWRISAQNSAFWKLESIDFEIKSGAMW